MLGPGWPGVLLHEAVGHGLEGDFNRKGSSAFSGRSAQRVAAPGVTVVDDGTLPGRRGSLTVDDEGNPTQRNVLIEDGVLRGYLQDSLNARLMKCPSPATRGARPSPTYPAAHDQHLHAGRRARPEGDHREREAGPLCHQFGGGQVNITNGEFVFSAAEAYVIEDGKVTHPSRGRRSSATGPMS